MVTTGNKYFNYNSKSVSLKAVNRQKQFMNQNQISALKTTPAVVRLGVEITTSGTKRNDRANRCVAAAFTSKARTERLMKRNPAAGSSFGIGDAFRYPMKKLHSISSVEPEEPGNITTHASGRSQKIWVAFQGKDMARSVNISIKHGQLFENTAAATNRVPEAIEQRLLAHYPKADPAYAAGVGKAQDIKNGAPGK